MLAKFGYLFLALASLIQADAQTTSLEFPFQFSEGLLWVQVHVSPSGQPLNFLLDSGASASILNLPAAEKLGVKLGKKLHIQGVNSTTIGYWSRNLSVTAGNISLPQDYVVVDLAKSSGLCEGRVDGLIGA